MNKMEDDLDLKIVKCLDGIHYSFEVLKFINGQLYKSCSDIKSKKSSVIPSIHYCWSFIDTVHRLREIAQSVPRLNSKNQKLRKFLDNTSLAEVYRHYIQHLRREINNPKNQFPVWGSLSWVDPQDSMTSHTIIIGAQISGNSLTSCVIDLHERKWVSKVCLGVLNYSFNFDPIFESCKEFYNFILPWGVKQFSKEVHSSDDLPIYTIRLLELQGRAPDLP